MFRAFYFPVCAYTLGMPEKAPKKTAEKTAKPAKATTPSSSDSKAAFRIDGLSLEKPQIRTPRASRRARCTASRPCS